MTAPIRVLLADDHPLLRTGLRAALAPEDDIALVGEAADGREARRLAQELQPDVLLLDVSMPGPPAFETVAHVREHCPATQVLIVTAYDNPALIRGMLAAGVAGYLLKDEPNAVVVQAIRIVAQGGTWVSRPVLEVLVQPKSAGVVEEEAPTLTDQELDVLRLMVTAMGDAEIGQALKISERTVRRYLHSAYNKLKVNTRVEAAVRAVQLGLVEV
ncbi:MAG: response regulator transcription factor [Ardenticatenaceae bacterium]|nr:response regulator transcription factor [Ardenticatenaceae bacterium]HBY97028.1 DNA-binding response regulator [Chloroflexota bacterium]